MKLSIRSPFSFTQPLALFLTIVTLFLISCASTNKALEQPTQINENQSKVEASNNHNHNHNDDELIKINTLKYARHCTTDHLSFADLEEVDK